MPRVVHFEIHANNPERAVNFYRNVFGWEVEKWEGPMDYWLLRTGKDEPGIDGAIMKRETPLAGNDGFIAYVCTVGVDSVDKFIEKVIDNNGELITPKTPIPGVGYFAECKDTEGNVFGLMHDDSNAK